MSKPWEETKERAENPKAGYRFGEVRAGFFVYVVAVDQFGRVYTEEYKAPCEVPKDGKPVTYQSVADFVKRLQYTTNEAFWVSYLDDKGHTLLGQLQEVHSAQG